MTLSVEDRLDILELLVRADNAASARNAAAYVALFTEDGVLDGAQGVHRGKAALRRAVGPVWAAEGAASNHLTLNVVIDPVVGRSDEATASSTLLIATGDAAPTIRTVTRIVQHVVRGDRRWLVSRRTVAPSLPPTMQGVAHEPRS
jgi:hypothetical protein